MPWFSALAIVLVVALLFLAARCIYTALTSLLHVLFSRRWLMVKGQITGCTVRTWRTTYGSGRPLYYTPEVTYQYSVRGQEHRADNLTFVSRHRGYTKLEAQEISTRYPIGTDVEVFYRPSEPAFAVLERTASLFYGVVGVALGMFSLICAGLLTLLVVAIALDGYLEMLI